MKSAGIQSKYYANAVRLCRGSMRCAKALKDSTGLERPIDDVSKVTYMVCSDLVSFHTFKSSR